MSTSQKGPKLVLPGACDDCLDWTPKLQLVKKETLLEAATMGHEDCLRAVLAEGVDVNTKNEKDNTALILASYNDNLSCVETIIKEGADVNQSNEFNNSALNYAAAGGYEGIVQALVEAGANVNTLGYSKSTPLMWAAEGGNEICVQSLIRGGADVNIRDKEQCTALIMAATKGSQECVDLLVKAGANVNVKGRGTTPLIEAAGGGYDECVDLLIKSGASVNKWGIYEMTPLFVAAARGHGKCLNLLIQAGANVKSNGGSCVIVAAEEGHYECVDQLIKAGADVNFGAPNRAAVHFAAKEGHHKCVKLLLDSGARVKTSGYYQTPLHFAVRRGHQECVTLLLEAGGEEWGTKALVYEAEREELENVVFLLRLGVAVSTIVFKRTTSRTKNENKIIEALFAAGQKVDKDRRPQSAKCDVQISLMNSCRETISEHLMQMSKINLFVRVPKLGLPIILQEYLLYNISLDRTCSESESTSETHEYDEDSAATNVRRSNRYRRSVYTRLPRDMDYESDIFESDDSE